MPRSESNLISGNTERQIGQRQSSTPSGSSPFIERRLPSTFVFLFHLPQKKNKSVK